MLCVCGSEQSRSANRAALDVVSTAARTRGAAVDTFDRVATIPPFHAERVDDPIPEVDAWRRAIDSADVVVIAAPEYAGGLAGVVKNALDWLVGSATLYRMPTAVISAGTTGGFFARQDLAQTLTWQGAYVVAELGIAVPRTKSDAEGRLVDPATVAALTDLVDAAFWSVTASEAELDAASGSVLSALDLTSRRVGS